MRRTILLAVIVAAAGGIGTGPAAAYCDPDQPPICRSDCPIGTPDIKNPKDLSWLIRMCPHTR